MCCVVGDNVNAFVPSPKSHRYAVRVPNGVVDADASSVAGLTEWRAVDVQPRRRRLVRRHRDRERVGADLDRRAHGVRHRRHQRDAVVEEVRDDRGLAVGGDRRAEARLAGLDLRARVAGRDVDGYDAAFPGRRVRDVRRSRRSA